MPELPEVETITNDLKRSVVGSQIIELESSSSKQIIPAYAFVKKEIEGAKITDARRRAKLMVLVLKKGKEPEKFLGIHLKMTGRLLLRKKGDMPDPYCRAVFSLFNTNFSTISRYSVKKTKIGLKNIKNNIDKKEDGEWELRFCDARKFGYIRLFKNAQELEEKVYQKLGPEPFLADFTPAYLENKSHNRTINIKALIMDQTMISGIGNIYANEALFLAKIKPHRSAKSLSTLEIVTLHKNIKEVLKRGIRYRGSSAKDENYQDLFGNSGSYQKYFLVYEKKGKMCPNSCGAVIQYGKLSGRGTFWCNKCQK